MAFRTFFFVCVCVYQSAQPPYSNQNALKMEKPEICFNIYLKLVHVIIEISLKMQTHRDHTGKQFFNFALSFGIEIFVGVQTLISV